MGEEARFVAKYASVYVRGNSFAEVGDQLHQRGFDMVRARQTDQGVLVIPHKNENRQAAHLFAMLDQVEVANKECVHAPGEMSLDAPPLLGAPPADQQERTAWARARVKEMAEQLDGTPVDHQLAGAQLAGEAVLAGVVEPIPLTCGECGAVHPEGVVCMVPIFFERKCCVTSTYPHEGPHEAATHDGTITHRWIEELVCTDLPFNAYGEYPEEGNDY